MTNMPYNYELCYFAFVKKKFNIADFSLFFSSFNGLVSDVLVINKIGVPIKYVKKNNKRKSSNIKYNT